MNPWRDLAGLPRACWILALATFVNRAGTMALSYLALYLTEMRGFSGVEAGNTASCFGLVALVVAPLAGRLSDRVGARIVMLGSLLSGGLAFLLFPLAQRPWELVAMTALLALCSEPFRPVCLAYVSDAVAIESRPRAFLLLRLAINLGLSVGPLLGGVLVEFGYDWLFLVNGATALAACGLSLQLPDVRHAALPAEQTRDVGSVLRDGPFLRVLLGCYLAAFVLFQHGPAMSLFMVRDLGLPKWHYGATYLVNTLLIVLVEVRLNVAMAHWRPGRVLALGALLQAIGFGANALCHDTRSILLVVPIWTFGEMILLPTLANVVADLAPKHRTGVYMGLYSTSFSLAYATAPASGVWLLERHGSTALWLAVAAIGLVPVWLLARQSSATRRPSRADT